MWERFALFALRGQVFRCCDCKKRFWLGVNWVPLVLGSLAALLVVGVFSAMIVAHNSRVAAATAAPLRRYPKAKSIRPLPGGLPGLANERAPK